jgi:hypothetical protein
LEYIHGFESRVKKNFGRMNHGAHMWSINEKTRGYESHASVLLIWQHFCKLLLSNL